VANAFSDNVTTFSIHQTTGALTEVGTEVAAGDGPESVTVDPSGRFAYVANNLSDNVTRFSIDATTGALTEVGTEVLAGDGPSSIVILGVLQ
jgi:6-phosphogluconolactonase (cycloisomerase 2 family)